MILEVLKSNNELHKYDQELQKQNQELQKQNQELQKRMMDLCKNGISNAVTNNNNQTNKFNINLFLNEKCKDAINFADFIKNYSIFALIFLGITTFISMDLIIEMFGEIIGAIFTFRYLNVKNLN